MASTSAVHISAVIRGFDRDATGCCRVLMSFDDGQRIRVEPGGGHRLADTADALALYVKRGCPQTTGVGPPLVTVPQQPHGQQPDLAMPQTECAAGHVRIRCPVTVPHWLCPVHVFGWVDNHQRHPPL